MSPENPFREEPTPSSSRESKPPSSTRRVKELAEQLKQYDQAEVRQEMEAHLIELMQPGLKIGEGQIADVYCGREADEMDGYCIKHKARTVGKSVYENSLEKEMQLQNTAGTILDEAREAGTPVARIPHPFAYVRTSDNREILAMDRVPGKTLYRIMLERVMQKLPQEHWLPGTTLEELPHLADEDLEEMVLRRYLRLKDKTGPQLYKALVAKAGDPPFLPTEAALKLRNTIRVLNRKKFYHRDLHEKNVMLSDDFSEVYMIDFGSSSYNEYDTLQDATELERLGENLRYQRDDGILTTIISMTKKTAPRA